MDNKEPCIKGSKDAQASSSDLESSVLKYIEFYFSDSNLNQNKYLRSLLESSSNKSITLDQLLTFNKIKELVGGDKALLLNILSKSELKNAQLLSETESLCRNTECPFTHDKNFLKNRQDLSLFLGNLGQGITMSDIIEWVSFYGECVVYPKKRDAVDKNKILSAIVVFSNGQNYQKFVNDVNNGVFLVNQKEKCKIVNLQVMPYQMYEKEREKLKKKKKHIKFIQKFLDMSVSGVEEGGDQPQKLFGMANLVAKRSLLVKFPSVVIPQPDELRNYLNPRGLIYLYQVHGCEWHYYLLFKNRLLMLEYFNASPWLDFQVGGPLAQAQFAMVDENNLPGHYEHYVKCVKNFFKKKQPFPLNMDVDL